jgi:pimeloyl-ACP methyl ester carboxylesterase
MDHFAADVVAFLDAMGLTQATLVGHSMGSMVAQLDDPVPEAFVREFQCSCTHQPLVGDFLDTVVGESLKLPARVWREVAAGIVAMDGRADLARVPAPTLVMWGDRDGVFGRSEQEQLCAGIPRATLVVHEQTGHTPHWERPVRFARTLQSFFESTPPARA